MFNETIERIGARFRPRSTRSAAGGGAAGERRGRSRSVPAPLLYLVAFSGVVSFFYDEALFRRSKFQFGAGVEWDESFQGFRPSAEQLARARKLNLEDRLLATTKEAWPECRAQGMTAIQCKDFIDYEILTLFTDEDKFIRTRIVGGRTLEDDWYNAVSIVMDDSNMVLGQDGDGWVRYQFEWDGSGTEATAEQQAAIPPVTAEETAAGSAQGDSVTTILNPDPMDAFEPIVPAPPATGSPTASPVASLSATTTATSATTTTGTTTTIETTTAPPEEAEFNPIVTGAAPLTGGSIPQEATTPPPGDSFNFDDPPVVPETDGPVLVEGATTDGAISGDDTNPINGGVILNDGTSTPGGTGEVLLQQILSTPPTIWPAGSRVVGPFNCAGLNGFQCCLAIKHWVRDADINGRAIQCFLDYEDSTCSKQWWLEAEGSKKVLIYTDQTELVLADPVISGSWPSCDDVHTDTRNWADGGGGTSSDSGTSDPTQPAQTQTTTTTTAPEAGWGGNDGGNLDASSGQCTPVGVGERCGADFNGLPCCDGYCCSAWGWCGTGATWCDFGCQSQCWASSDTTGLTVQERCGDAAGGKVCHGTYCCSAAGYCGSGELYCETSQGCQSGCWPDAGDGTAAATEIPPSIEEECRGSVNICIAMDMSGSVCSPDFFSPQQCKHCPSDCQSGGHDRDTCCPNFQTIKDFGINVINWVNHLQFGANRRSISLVTFDSWGHTDANLGDDVLQAIANLDYQGGLTNHGEAFDHCQNTFTGHDGQNYILLVTDGVATTSDASFSKSKGEAHGRARADYVKGLGTIVETVYINPGQATNSEKTYMNYMSSSGSYHDIGDFEELGTEVNDVAYKLACSGSPTGTPIVPDNVVDVADHCGCALCTDTVWETWVGSGWSWYTCGARIEWMMSSQGYSEADACAYITSEFPTGCPCDC